MAFAKSRSWSLMAVAALSLAPLACSGDDAEQPQEPVAPTTETTPYPEDPDMAPKPDQPAKPDDTPDGVGELTNDPFKGQKPPEGDEAVAGATPSDDVMPPVDEGDAMEGALNGNDAAYKTAPGETPVVPDGPGLTKGKAGKGGKGKGGGKVASGKGGTRYVNTIMLNVRSKPTRNAPVVRRILGGSMVHAEVHGKYAKIKEGQWVRTRYLSTTPTRKVSRAEAEKAWHKSRKGKSGKTAKAGKSTKSKAKGKKKAPAAEPAPVAEPAPEAAPAPAPEPDAPLGAPETPPEGG